MIKIVCLCASLLASVGVVAPIQEKSPNRIKEYDYIPLESVGDLHIGDNYHWSSDLTYETTESISFTVSNARNVNSPNYTYIPYFDNAETIYVYKSGDTYQMRITNDEGTYHYYPLSTTTLQFDFTLEGYNGGANDLYKSLSYIEPHMSSGIIYDNENGFLTRVSEWIYTYLYSSIPMCSTLAWSIGGSTVNLGQWLTMITMIAIAILCLILLWLLFRAIFRLVSGLLK